MLVAPEGTRVAGEGIGEFKKGAFRMAMAAKVPIVPIVIRNAEVISARDSSTLHPGTVDVVVYPPLSLEDWTLDNLSDRIAEVRQLYIDTLKSWPVGSVPKADLYDRPTSPPKKAPAKKAPTKKAPAKKAPAKKATAKKAAGQTTAAKKAAPQKNPETRLRGRR